MPTVWVATLFSILKPVSHIFFPLATSMNAGCCELVHPCCCFNSAVVVINTMYGSCSWLCCTEKSKDHTSFVTGALAACSKVECFPDGQLCQVNVLLVDIAGGPLRNELIKGVAIVRDATLHLQQAHAKKILKQPSGPSGCRTQGRRQGKHTDTQG